MLQQGFEQCRLASRELDKLALPAHDPGCRIELEGAMHSSSASPDWTRVPMTIS